MPETGPPSASFCSPLVIILFLPNQIPTPNLEKLAGAENEIKMFNLMGSHPGYLKLLGSRIQRNKGERKCAFLLFPLMDTSLYHQVIEGKGIYEQQAALRLCKNLSVALQAIHKAGFVHGDLKPQNVLLSKEGNPVLCDLASCRPLNRTASTRKEALEIQEDAQAHCTASYRAPELHDVRTGSTVDGKSDIFSLGCTLYFSVIGKNPYDGPEGFLKLALMQGAVEYPADATKKISKGFRSLLKSMLKANPSKRLTVETCIFRIGKLSETHENEAA